MSFEKGFQKLKSKYKQKNKLIRENSFEIKKAPLY